MICKKNESSTFNQLKRENSRTDICSIPDLTDLKLTDLALDLYGSKGSI